MALKGTLENQLFSHACDATVAQSICEVDYFVEKYSISAPWALSDRTLVRNPTSAELGQS